MAVIEEIGACGGTDLKVAQLAQRAGMSSALAHHYFGSKQQMLLAGLEQLTAALDADLLRTPTTGETPRTRLDAIVETVFAPRHFNQATSAAWLTYYRMARGSAAADRLVRQCARSLRHSLCRALQPMTPQSARIAGGAVAMIDGLFVAQATRHGHISAHGAMTMLRDYFDRQLAGDVGGPPA